MARLGARQHQAGHVRARDQQHAGPRALQHEDGGSRRTDDLRLQIVEAKPMPVGVWACAGPDWRSRFARSTPASPASSVSSSALADCERRALVQPADQIEEVIAAILPVRRIEHERKPDLDVLGPSSRTVAA